jgi:hypothetical protein
MALPEDASITRFRAASKKGGNSPAAHAAARHFRAKSS